MDDVRANQKSISVSWAQASLALSMLLSSLGISIVNVALPTFTDVFSVSYHAVQWVVLSYLLAITISIVVVGRLGDLFGHRRMLLGGVFLFTFASLLCGLANSLWLLLAARVFQGVGAAVLMAVTVVLVREISPAKNTGSAMGLLETMSATGTALGPSLGGVLLSGPGWRAIFFIMIPLGVLNFTLAQRTLPKDKVDLKTASFQLDLLGTAALAIALASYAGSMTVSGIKFDRFSISFLLTSVFAGGLFLLIEKKAKSPLIRLSAFRNLVLSGGLAMNVIVAAVMMATLIVGPFFLAIGLGLAPILVGLTLSIGPVISMFSGILAGRSVDRHGGSKIVIFGLTSMIIGSLALSKLPAIYGISGYVAAIVILTPGYQLFQAANNTVVMNDVPTDQRGVISGTLGLSRNLGLITGASVMGAVFAFASGAGDLKTATPDSIACGMGITFLFAAGLLSVALAIAVATPIISKKKYWA
jgi:MFS family permease